MAGLALILALAGAAPPTYDGRSIILTVADAAKGRIAVPDTKGGEVVVRGDGKLPVILWFDRSWATITADAAGTVTVEDVHATGQKITLQNVPVLYFSGGDALKLPGLTPIGGAPAAPSAATAGGPTTSPSEGPPVLAPTLPQPHGPPDIVAVRLRNSGPTPLPGRVVVFGQAFVAGDLPEGTGLAAILPVQMTVKARHADGSVRHAVIALQAPPLAAGGSVDVMLTHGAPVAGPGLAPADILASGYDLQLEVTFAGAGPVTVSAATALKDAIAKGTVPTWLRNPLVSEYRVAAPINDRLTAIFDIRATADHEVATDVIVTNDAAYLPPQRFVYRARLIDHGKTLWQTAEISHDRFQVWHQVVPRAASPDVVLDVPYLIRSGAVAAFDLSLGINSGALDNAVQALGAASTGPLGKATVTPYMPETGGRDDIGLVPNWTANYLVSQDPRARRVMLANADAAGSVPWHVREADGRLVTALAHPTLWLDPRCATGDCLPGGYDTGHTGWTLDTAHVPDLSYVPYLVTGRHFYLDQLQAQANWDMLAGNPGYRGGAKALVYPLDQLRGVAWDIRDMANAAWATPDDDPLKAYFTDRTNGNLANLAATQLGRTKEQGALAGYVFDPDHPEQIAPWQQDMLALTLVQQAMRGQADAGKLASWMVGFTAGRFLHAADGFNPLNGPAYWPKVVDPATGRAVTTWRGFNDLNFAGQPEPTALDGYPAENGGYAAVARAATASLFSATRSTDALRAYAFLVSATQEIDGSFQAGAFYDINPVLPDGHVLQNREIQYALSGQTLTANHGHSLLIGRDGPTTLHAAAGISILYAGSGPTSLIAAPGTTYLFGGSAATTMTGSAGSNFFDIGGGPTRITLNATDHAVDTVAHFRPGIDHIHITGGQAPSPAASGGRIVIGPNHTLALHGIAPADITPALFD